MKIHYIILSVLIFFSIILKGQISLTAEIETKLRDDAKKWMETYVNNLNSLGSSAINPMEKTMIIENAIKQFEDDAVVVFNDLDMSGKMPKEFKVRQHLGNIVSLFAINGVDFKFSNIIVSNVFIDKAKNNLFLKIELLREINGKNVNGNSVTGTLKLDFYIKYNVTGNSISQKPLIYSIDEHRENINSFTKVNIQEKSDNSAALLKENKEMEEINKAANEQEAILKKKEEEASKAFASADSATERMNEVRMKFFKESYGTQFSFHLFPLRLVEGVLQAGLAKRIIANNKFTLALDVSAGFNFKAVGGLISFNDSSRNEVLYDKMHFWSKAGGYVLRGEIHLHFGAKKWYVGYMFNKEKTTWQAAQYPLTEQKTYDVARSAAGNHFMIGSVMKRWEIYFALGMKNASYKFKNVPTDITTASDFSKSTASILLGAKLKFNK